tara:strand:- start:1144 stop:1338 length:195 start_codon:yes stop_codon:yes gene_type:complete
MTDKNKTTKVLEVNITYARVALMLLALNLLGTGYALTKLSMTAEPVEEVTPTEVTTTSEEDTSS